MARVQLGLNVSDLDAAVDFYTRLLGTPPAKREPRYANFAVADPPLKLVLFEQAGSGGTVNHLGIEMASSDEVQQATARLTAEGLALRVDEQVDCCYAVQDKAWVTDPDALGWEVYTVLADTSTPVSCC